MASPQPPYGHPGPSSYYQPPPHPNYVYGNHSPTPYQYQQHQQHYPPPPPHMNGSMQHMSPASARGRGVSYGPPRGAPGPSYQNFHSIPPYPPPIPLSAGSNSPSSPYLHSAKFPPPHPQQYPQQYVMQAPPTYPATWPSQQPLSPMPKQLSMPPPHVPVSPAPPPIQPMEPVPSSASTQLTEPSIEPSIPSSTDLPQSQLPTQSFVGTIPNAPTTQHSSSPSELTSAQNTSTSESSLKGGWAIWSRRPHDPSHAPGIIISPRARPPQDVIQNAIEMPTPPASPSPVSSPSISVAKALPNEDGQTNGEVPSASATETNTTPACSTAPDTPVPGSPLSTNTSLSMAPGTSPGKGKSESTSVSQESPKAENTASASEDKPDVPAAEQTPQVEPPSQAPPPAKPVPKSWASLLRPASVASSSSKPANALPTSSVVGFSIPGTDGPAPLPVSPSKQSELLALLTNGPISSSTPSSPPKISPRGLINTGNMCFANSVLQILIYCPPFYRLFTDLGKHMTGPVVGKAKETPLVDATIQFLKEFEHVESDRKAKEGDVKQGGKPNGKGKEVDREVEDDTLDSFIPSYVYDAMKEKKRFDNMRGGHQEDAEEFLGFYLDTLEEELLSVANAISPNAATESKEVEEREEEEPPEEDGWMEVGRRNRMVITRTIKTAESPITRMFGGKFRSTLRAPQQKDSVVIEDWRALQLDIQRDQVHTVKDALQYISTPSSVQVTSPTRPGVTLEASQQVLIETVPPILVLHMKRFLYDTKVNGVVKIGKQVSFGPELEIGSEIVAPARKGTQSVRYKLFGVLYHHGLSASGGHYTLDVLHPNRDLGPKAREGWIRIDDEFVSDVRPEDVFGGVDRDDRCAYLLFYRRIGGGLASGHSRT